MEICNNIKTVHLYSTLGHGGDGDEAYKTIEMDIWLGAMVKAVKLYSEIYPAREMYYVLL